MLNGVHPGDLGPAELGKLDGVHARAAAGAVDQHLPAGPHPCVVVDALQRDGPAWGRAAACS
jgi:hypothetical protein